MIASLRDRPALLRLLGAGIVAVLVTSLISAAVRHRDGEVTGAGRLEVDGMAVVSRPDGARLTVTDTANLHDGDLVEAREGTFLLRLVGGSTLEGRAAAAKVDATKLRAGAHPELLAGDLLAVASQPTTVDAAGNHIEVRPAAGGAGAVRMSRSLAVRLGAYRGTAVVDSAGQQRTVPALRALEIAVLGRPPATPKPLLLDHPDTWDRRYLGEAIDLGQSLQSLSNSYSPTLRVDEGRDAAFYERLLPTLATAGGLDDGLVRLWPTRPQGEILVGAAIASLGRSASLAERWQAVFDFRDDGATWGLVALDQAVSSGPLLDAVKAAVDRTTFQFAAATPTRFGARPQSAAPTTPPGPGSEDASTTPTTEPSTPTSAPPPTTTPPLTTPTVPTVPSLPSPLPSPPPPPGNGGSSQPLGGLVDTVGQLLGGLLGH